MPADVLRLFVFARHAESAANAANMGSHRAVSLPEETSPASVDEAGPGLRRPSADPGHRVRGWTRGGV
jgi:hypothetical protein